MYLLNEGERTMRIYSFLTIFLLSGLLLFSCQNNSTVGGDLKTDNVVTEQAAFGFQINDIANTSNEIDEINSDPMAVDETIPGGSSLNSVRSRAQNMAKEVKAMNLQLPSLSKTNGDSAYFRGEDSTANGKKTRWAVYYNILTGKARYVSVIYQFPEGRNIKYDSTEIILNMGIPFGNGNGNPEEYYQLQLFKDAFFIESITNKMTFSDYLENGEPQSMQGATETTYRDGRNLKSKKISFVWNTDKSGSIRTDFHFNDGTDTYEAFTFNGDNSGTFSKLRYDGTTVTGTFNQVNDDGQGSYAATVDFPNGYYLDKIEKAAAMWLQGIDSVFTATYAEKIFFSSGKIDSSNSSITVNNTEGGVVTTISATKPNGAHGTITISEVVDGTSTMSGFWTTWDNYYIVVSAEYYMDGSSHLHYDVYQNEAAYTNGDDPLIVADYNFNGEQGGDGTLTYGDTVYNVTFDGSGEATISDGSNTKTIPLYF